MNVGLFGYTESLSVPYATLSLAVEFTAAFVLAGRRGATRPRRHEERGEQPHARTIAHLRCADNGNCGNLRGAAA